MRIRLTSFPGAGLRVPCVGIGASGFSHACEREAAAIIDGAIARGMTFFDTADVYGEGESEEVLGRGLAGRREDCIISTKCGHRKDAQGGSRRSIRRALDASLRRLRTDYVDILHLHAPDPVTPLEETISTFQDLVREGKARYYGFCNFEPWRLMDAHHVARATGGPPPIAVQVQASAVQLSTHRELAPVLQRCTLGLLAASPLARGLLGRGYTFEKPPPADHPLRGRKGYLLWSRKNVATAQRLREIAEGQRLAPARLALDLVLTQPFVVAALVRPRTAADLEDYTAAGKNSLGLEEANYVLYGRDSREADRSEPAPHLQEA